MRIALVIVVAVALALAAFVVIGSPFDKGPVTRSDIEAAVAKRPKGHVQLVLCNVEVLPSRTPRPASQTTWTCDTYIGASKASAQDNGPSYLVVTDKDSILSIRRVPTH